MIKHLYIFLIQIYRFSLSREFRFKLKKIFKFFYYKYRFLKLLIHLRITNKQVNIIIGAALTKQKGWFSTNEEWFDVSQEKHWYRLFKGEKRIKRVLAEHVLEHLYLNQMRSALSLIYKYMEFGGSLRIAVPDGNHPNKDYRKFCGINGKGADASDHKQFLTFEVLSKEASRIGFKCYLLEGYTRDKKLVTKEFNDNLGKVLRTRNNKNNQYLKEGWDFVDANSSLIIDCFK